MADNAPTLEEGVEHAADHALDAAHGAVEHVSTAFYADPTFWATVAVLIFLGILVWKKIPAAIAKSLDDRAAKIRDELDEARKLREQAQEMLAEAERRKANAEADAAMITSEAEAEATAIAEQARKDLDERIARREKMAEDRIGRAEAEATQQVRTAAADAASAAAARSLKDKLTGAAATKQFEQALADVKKAL